jgi:hypothetical protein
MLVKQKVNGETKQMVKPAILITEKGPIGDRKKVKELIKKSKWQKGFTNMAQGIIAACKMVQRRGRWWSNRKVVVISDGQPTLEFATTEAAQECKDRNVVLDFIVVSTSFDKKNKAWDAFKALPSFPWHAHTHHINGLDELMMKPVMLANRMLPRICPHARSVSRVISFAAKEGYMMVHRGRDCGNWWFPLGKHRTAKSCARRAARLGFKSFVFQFSRILRSRRGRYWCWTDGVQGKKEPTKKDEPFTPIDDTCACTSLYCTGKVKGGKKGWSNQRILWSTGYSHYMVVTNGNDFQGDAMKRPFAPMLAEVSKEDQVAEARKAFEEVMTEESSTDGVYGEEGEDPMTAEDVAEARKEFEQRLGEKMEFVDEKKNVKKHS